MKQNNPLSESQIQALRELQGVFGVDTIVLIGASALGFFMNMHWRETRDLDFAVAVETDDVMNLGEGLEGWEHDRHQEQRFRTPGEVLVDLIPAAPSLLEAGEVVWPSGFRMSLVGMRLAFSEAHLVEPAAELSLRIAPPEIVALLKVVAYLDRPSERRHDLSDIAHILEYSVRPEDQARYSDDVLDRGYDYDEAGAYVVGQRIGRTANEQEATALDGFLRKALEDEDPGAIRQRLVMSGPRSWRDEEEEVRRRLEALRDGLGRHR